MKLKFFAKKDLLVNMPEQAILRGNVDTGARGAPIRYVGRVYIPAVIDRINGVDRVRVPASNPATEEPFECDADSDIGRRLVKITRRDHCLWPADEETAGACMVPFVVTKFENGEHVEADPKPLLDLAGRVKHCSPVGTPGEVWAKEKPVTTTEEAQASVESAANVETPTQEVPAEPEPEQPYRRRR